VSPNAQIAALSGLAIVLIALAIYIALRVHGTPEKRERRRRLSVNRLGRLGDALITEVSESIIYYSYSLRGVQYTASQDVSALMDRLPADHEKLIGVASMKYAPNNPYNSILICEEWSGLRVADRKAG